MTVDLTQHRREFLQNGLRRSELDPNPFKQFDRWFKQAEEMGVLEPSAMSLATTDGVDVSLRTVFLKFFDERGFVFYTNYGSKKAKQLAVNPHAALLSG